MKPIVEHVDRIAGHRSARILIWAVLAIGLGWAWQRLEAIDRRLVALEVQADTNADLIAGVALTLCYASPTEAARSRLPCAELQLRPPVRRVER